MPTDEELLSRQMPHNVEAEQAVLGSILIDSRMSAPDRGEQLKPDDFYIRQNREAFQTIYTMFSMSQKIDPVTVLQSDAAGRHLSGGRHKRILLPAHGR